MVIRSAKFGEAVNIVKIWEFTLAIHFQGDSNSEWKPDPKDKNLNIHPFVKNVVPVMLRRGISCAAMVDVLRVLHYTVVEQREVLTDTHRLVSETELRTLTNQVRDEFLKKLSLLEFDGQLLSECAL